MSAERTATPTLPHAQVGGLPRRAALSAISRESFDRGWYAGPFGAIGPDDAEFCVAIRSALVTASAVYAYSGAGIVSGSDEDEELSPSTWMRRNLKTSPKPPSPTRVS